MTHRRRSVSHVVLAGFLSLVLSCGLVPVSPLCFADGTNIDTPAIPQGPDGEPLLSRRDDAAQPNLNVYVPQLDPSLVDSDVEPAAVDIAGKISNMVGGLEQLMTEYANNLAMNDRQSVQNQKIATTPKEKEAEKKRHASVAAQIYVQIEHAIEAFIERLAALGIAAALSGNRLTETTPTKSGWLPSTGDNYLYTAGDGAQAKSYFFPSHITRTGRKLPLAQNTLNNTVTPPSATYGSGARTVPVQGTPYVLGRPKPAKKGASK
jgi:hypothetical protein